MIPRVHSNFKLSLALKGILRQNKAFSSTVQTWEQNRREESVAVCLPWRCGDLRLVEWGHKLPSLDSPKVQEKWDLSSRTSRDISSNSWLFSGLKEMRCLASSCRALIPNTSEVSPVYKYSPWDLEWTLKQCFPSFPISSLMLQPFRSLQNHSSSRFHQATQF